mgnify:CR=1 FL=1
MPKFRIFDLLAATLVVGLHFGVTLLLVRYESRFDFLFVLGFPVFLTALVQYRLNLSWIFATLACYPIAIIWAFFYGATYSILWNNQPHDFFEYYVVGPGEPLESSLLNASMMSVYGLPICVLYFVLSWLSRTYWPGANNWGSM